MSHISRIPRMGFSASMKSVKSGVDEKAGGNKWAQFQREVPAGDSQGFGLGRRVRRAFGAPQKPN
jgi:hypothetical protein